MTVRELAQQLRARKISCVELINDTLSALKTRDTFRSVITLMEGSARAEAEERDKELAAGRDRGPFHGIPIAHKDLLYTRGVPTTAGSLLFRDFVPTYDATVVERFKAAGAICVAKTNLHELAYGITSRNPHFGAVLNPRDTSRIPGGSSGGSGALVAAGLLPMATGSDTGGSIRIPASYCGITGLKPTYGRVSRYGVLPLAFSLDHIGPMGSCVEDCALAMNAMADGEFNLPALPTLRGVRIGVPKNFYFERIDPEVNSAVMRAVAEMERQGAAVSEIQVPDMDAINTAALMVQLPEASSLYERHTDASQFGSDVWLLIQQGKLIPAHEYVNAQRLRTLFRQDFDALWEKIDVLATPTTPIVAPRVEETTVQIGAVRENTRMATTRLVRAINYLGNPALSLPCGSTAAGLPVGLQLIGAPFSEPQLLQLGRAVEASAA
jgi:aspartyl-tRNA(Asn)/glutamyl-tRNA(Gln) amidotransferase subunit A